MNNPFKQQDHSFEAFPAVIVADQTDRLGKRLGKFALWILVLFFAISASVQSAQNGRQLTRAAKDRSNLIESTEQVTKTLNSQSELIKQLQDAIRAQNKTLRDAGLQIIKVPGETPKPEPNPTPGVSPRPQPTSSPSLKPHQSPKPRPSPTPDPVSQARETICELTGIGCPKEN